MHPTPSLDVKACFITIIENKRKNWSLENFRESAQGYPPKNIEAGKSTLHKQGHKGLRISLGLTEYP